jgi:hypothetical protein
MVSPQDVKRLAHDRLPFGDAGRLPDASRRSAAALPTRTGFGRFNGPRDDGVDAYFLTGQLLRHRLHQLLNVPPLAVAYALMPGNIVGISMALLLLADVAPAAACGQGLRRGQPA